MSEKLYKYYFFYLTTKEGKPELYAYTDNKGLSDKFQNQRDMNVFTKKTHKVSKDVVNDLALQKPECILEEVNGKTKERTHGSPIIDFDVVLTSGEKMSIISDYGDLVYSKLWTFARYSPILFNDNIRKSLCLIDYNLAHYTYHDECHDMHANEYIKMNNLTTIKDIEINPYSYTMDLFGVLFYHYGKLFKKE